MTNTFRRARLIIAAPFFALGCLILWLSLFIAGRKNTAHIDSLDSRAIQNLDWSRRRFARNYRQ